MKKIIVAIMSVILCLGLAACGSDSGSSDQSGNATPSEETKPEYTTYEAGAYKVGSDLPAGEYFIEGSGYFEIDKDSSGTFESILANDNYVNRTYITVSDGQYVEFEGTAIPVNEAPAYSKDTYEQGMYKIGKDLPAGEYKIESIDGADAYLEVNSDSTHTFESIISNDNFSGQKYITVSDGQYLKLVNCTIVQ